MKADYLSYRRATTVCWLGLLIQIVLAASVLVFSFYSRDEALRTAALFMGAGVPIWLTLGILFDQARRERVEAMEVEALAAADAASASVFERGPGQGETRVAARRLAMMQQWLVPAVSLLVGGGLVALGVWRFLEARELVSPDRFPAPRLRGWTISIGLAIAFVGFVFARFTYGMAKQRVWSNLRAGSAVSVGSALIGLAVAIAHFVDIAGTDAVVRYLDVAISVFTAAIGIEILLNFLLDLYRPRKKGEIARPAFDSRVLGFVAAPDRIAKSIGEAINYQFGYEVTGTWFYQFISRIVVVLIFLGVVVLWSLSSLVVVRPDQNALLLRFGKIVRSDLGPGLHLKLPWPIDEVIVPAKFETVGIAEPKVVARTTTGVRTIHLGSEPAAPGKPVFWTNEHITGAEKLLVCRASSAITGIEESQDEADPTVRDRALVAIEVPLYFDVSNVELFEELGQPEQRDAILESVGRREVMLYFSGLTVEQILGRKRSDLSQDLAARLRTAYATLNGGRGAGVRVLFVGVEGVHPPREIAANFERLVQAEQNRHATLDLARADAVETLTRVVGSVDLADRVAREIDELDRQTASGTSAQALAEQRSKIEALLARAGGEAAAMIATASAERWRDHLSAKAAAIEHVGQMAAYEAAPSVYMASLYLESLRELMNDARLYITPDNPYLRWELQDRDTSADVFNPQPEEQFDLIRGPAHTTRGPRPMFRGAFRCDDPRRS